MFGLGGGEISVIFVVIFLVGVLPIITTLWALIDVLKNEFTGSNKLIWLLVTIFLHPFGALIYYFVGRNQKVLAEASDSATV